MCDEGDGDGFSSELSQSRDKDRNITPGLIGHIIILYLSHKPAPYYSAMVCILALCVIFSFYLFWSSHSNSSRRSMTAISNNPVKREANQAARQRQH